MKFFATLVLCCTAARAGELLIAAASDLAPIAPKLEKAYPEKIRFTLGSSGLLKQQIENGAPFDVFLSANESYVRDLAAAGLVTDVTVYAIGRLALWSPNGVAAKEALEARGLWKAVEPKIVYGENVRQALQFAESGNVEAVIASWTLLIGKGTLLPAEWHKPIRQTGAILKSSAQGEAARRFLKFLIGPEAQKILID